MATGPRDALIAAVKTGDFTALCVLHDLLLEEGDPLATPIHKLLASACQCAFSIVQPPQWGYYDTNVLPIVTRDWSLPILRQPSLLINDTT